MTKFVSDEQLKTWHKHQPPTSPEVVAAHEKVRAEFLALSLSMNNLLPECPDKSAALRRLWDAAKDCNAIIATQQRLYSDD